jgi:adenylate cyclase
LTHIYVLYLAHNFDAAINQAKQTLDLFPDSRAVYYWLGQCYEKRRMPDDAIAAYLKALGHLPAEATRRRAAYQKDGLPGFWQRDRQFRQISNRENDPVIEAMYYAHIGEQDKAVDQLNLGYQQHCDGLQFLKVEPVYDSLRDEPRFKDLIARLKL